MRALARLFLQNNNLSVAQEQQLRGAAAEDRQDNDRVSRKYEKLGTAEIAAPFFTQFDQLWPGLKTAFKLRNGPAMNVTEIKTFFRTVRGDRRFQDITLPYDGEIEKLFAQPR